jgi:hypothetical protein
MSQAFVIEISDRTAGVAVREADGFRFYASDALFEPLGALTFTTLRKLRGRAEAVLRASRGTTRPSGAGLAVADENFAYALSAG